MHTPTSSRNRVAPDALRLVKGRGVLGQPDESVFGGSVSNTCQVLSSAFRPAAHFCILETNH
jgi:hypothetical protein